ncbi:hypothetical protein F383_00965 [Gossypium arboreum]|nr:hypothetical protein F383_00965 [Gossypium arboreum]
MFVDIRDFGCK